MIRVAGMHRFGARRVRRRPRVAPCGRAGTENGAEKGRYERNRAALRRGPPERGAEFLMRQSALKSMSATDMPMMEQPTLNELMLAAMAMSPSS